MSELFTQENRYIAVRTALGENVLLLKSFNGTEGISRLFSFELHMLSTNSNIGFDSVVGKDATISLRLFDGKSCYFNGLVNRFVHASGGAEGDEDVRLAHYTATVVPKMWLLTRTANLKIFQNKTVPEIVEDVLKDKGITPYELHLKGSYKKRDYCVQYRETDFNFVSRLLEEEGIYYFFKHENGKHTLILIDKYDPGVHVPCPGQRTATINPNFAGWLEEDVITDIEKLQQIQAGKYTLKDYNFETPGTDLKVETPSSVTLGPGDREIYDYPGLYSKHSEGDNISKVRMEEEEARITYIGGSSVCRAFRSGFRFKLEGPHRKDMDGKEFLLTSVGHSANQGGYHSGSETTEFSYANHFGCIPADVQYRPNRSTPKPVVYGTQTAIVVGPSGEEIYTDKYGRIKVQFHWDRLGKRDDKSSCWIRVAQLWASSQWGAVYIPRIDQEVIVDFLEGDPDRPIVIGCLYHGNNMPPYALPDEKTKSTIKSNSTKGGGGFNEIRFEDKKGKEEIYVHAQRDSNTKVGNDRTVIVYMNDAHTIQKGDRKVTIEKGSDTLNLQTGDRKTTIDKGNYAHTVSMGKMDVSVPSGTYTLKANKVMIDAGADITLKCGGSTINIGPAMIKLESPLVQIKGNLVKIN
jgi:type VI secretion system secreted protein VgrG